MERLRDPRLQPRRWRETWFELEPVAFDVDTGGRRCESDLRRREFGGAGEGVEQCTVEESSETVVGGLKQEMMEASAAETRPTAQIHPLRVVSSPASPVGDASRMRGGSSPEARLSTRVLPGAAAARFPELWPQQTRGSSSTASEASPVFFPTELYSPQQPSSVGLQALHCQHPGTQYPTTAYLVPLPQWPQMARVALLPTPVAPSVQSQTGVLPRPPVIPSSTAVTEPQVGSPPPSAQLPPVQQNASLMQEGQPLVNLLPPQQTPPVPPSTAKTAQRQKSPPSLQTQAQSESEPRRPPSYPWEPGFLCEGEQGQEGQVFTPQPPQWSSHFSLPPTQLQPYSALAVPLTDPWQAEFMYSDEQEEGELETPLEQESSYFSLPHTQLQGAAAPLQPSPSAWESAFGYHAQLLDPSALAYEDEPLTEEDCASFWPTQQQGETAPAVYALNPWQSEFVWSGDQEQGEPSASEPHPPPWMDPRALRPMQWQASSAPSGQRPRRGNCKCGRSAVQLRARSSTVPPERPQAPQSAHPHSEGHAPRCRLFSQGHAPQCPLQLSRRQQKCTASSQPPMEGSHHQPQQLPNKSGQTPSSQTPQDERPYSVAPPPQIRDAPPLAPPPLPPRPPPPAQPESQQPPQPSSVPPPTLVQPPVQPPGLTLASPVPTPLFYSCYYCPPQYSVMVPPRAQIPCQPPPQQAWRPGHGASGSPQVGQHALQTWFWGPSGPAAPPTLPTASPRSPPPSEPPAPPTLPTAPPLPRSPPPSQPPPPASPPPEWTGVRPPLPESAPPARPPLPPSSPPGQWGTGEWPPLPTSPGLQPTPSTQWRPLRRREANLASTPRGAGSQRVRHSAVGPVRIRELLVPRRRAQRGAKPPPDDLGSP
ncbi:hypothetical protein V5799_026950 [Amblyomma americanum]|uniref:Uncharacterized protein n=1 Tax=Amblyomma americanum TaxID=6943 RepID=A0AAQ4DH39_AMBAM